MNGGSEVTADGRDDLHEQLILTHSNRPVGRVELDHPTASSHQLNRTCGDEITLSIEVDAGTIARVGWRGHGCTVSQSSASMLSTLAAGRSLDDTRELLAEFRAAMRSRGTVELEENRFGDAVALTGASRLPGRVTCAMLAWMALEAALEAAPRAIGSTSADAPLD